MSADGSGGPSLLDKAARIGGRLLMSKAAALQEEELASDAFAGDGDQPATLYVVDRGADTTVFSFSNAGLLHAGLPTFAFAGLFERQARPCNLVCLRDIHRTAYHLTPSGEPDGLAHYEGVIREAMEALPGTRHIAIGESSGAAAALHFGTLCGMDKVVCFSLPYPIQVWTSVGAVLHAVFNLRELLRDPPSYWDVLMITFFSVLARRALRRSVGEDGIVDPVRTYLEAARRPRLTLFHGARCRPDTQIAGLLTEAPEARFVTFPTGRHILWTPIARQGSIEELITGELDSLDSGS